MSTPIHTTLNVMTIIQPSVIASASHIYTQLINLLYKYRIAGKFGDQILWQLKIVGGKNWLFCCTHMDLRPATVRAVQGTIGGV